MDGCYIAVPQAAILRTGCNDHFVVTHWSASDRKSDHQVDCWPVADRATVVTWAGRRLPSLHGCCRMKPAPADRLPGSDRRLERPDSSCLNHGYIVLVDWCVLGRVEESTKRLLTCGRDGEAKQAVADGVVKAEAADSSPLGRSCEVLLRQCAEKPDDLHLNWDQRSQSHNRSMVVAELMHVNSPGIE